MKQGGCHAQVENSSDVPFSDASVGIRSSVRSRRRSRVFKRQAYGCHILIATNISTCSRLFSKSLGVLPAGWIMFGFGILSARGENRGTRQWDAGSSDLV